MSKNEVVFTDSAMYLCSSGPSLITSLSPEEVWERQKKYDELVRYFAIHGLMKGTDFDTHNAIVRIMDGFDPDPRVGNVV